jgi:hypothetical protein
MLEALIVIVVLILLIGIFRRTGRSGNRTGDAWFTRPCPHCRQGIASSATVCAWCSRDVPRIEPGRFESIKRLVAIALTLVIGYAFVTQQAPRENPREPLLSGVAGPTPPPVSAPETKIISWKWQRPEVVLKIYYDEKFQRATVSLERKS